jgi:hypothetical protein
LTGQKNAAAVAKCDGPAFKLIGKAGTGYGMAEVIIAGGTPIPVEPDAATAWCEQCREEVAVLNGASQGLG